MDSFITLASDANLELFPENRIGSFRTRLSHPITIDRTKCRVGLHSITFPNSLPNIADGRFQIRAYNIGGVVHRDTGDDGVTVETRPTRRHIETRFREISPGFYKSPRDIVDSLNAKIRATRFRSEELRHYHNEFEGSLIEFSYDSHTEKISLMFPHEGEIGGWFSFDIKLSPELFVKLGFGLFEEERRTLRAPSVAEHTIYLNAGLSSIFVYCDIVEKNRLIGTQITDLLCVVPLVGSHNKNCHYQPSNVEYRNLRYDVLEEISIFLVGVTGEVLPFLSGKVVLTIHIKEIF